MQASVPERLISALGAVCVVALLGYLMLVGMAVAPGLRIDQSLTLFALPTPQRKSPPPPHVVPPKVRHSADRKRLPNPEGKASPRAAMPVLLLPPTSLAIPTLSMDGLGVSASRGTSDQPGSGMGAGGSGTGGGGGDGDVPPRLLKGRLKFSDLPEALRGPDANRRVSVRYAVDIDGRVRDCSVTASSGSEELDQRTCALIEERFRFAPSRDGDGRPVRSIIEESHTWEAEGGRDPPSEP
jgi:protein TonB